MNKTLDHQVNKISKSNKYHPLQSMIAEKKIVHTPNIYLLVYDAYVINETMLQYGIDNSDQENFLTTKGFKLYPHTYSVGSATLSTMSRVLDISTKIDGPYQKATAGDGIVQNAFQHLGYETYGLFPSDYEFRGVGSNYDHSLPEKISYPVNVYLTSSILSGEFRFDIGFEEQSYHQYVETKQEFFQDIYQRKVFVYSHSNKPDHSQNSGACLENEIELYKERLAIANNEMQNDVNILIKNDPEAIIIIASDHGPYLTKNCTRTSGVYDISAISRLDIQDRYGTFLAIRYPTEEFTDYDDILILQDIFPVIFAYIYQDEEFLNLRIIPETIDPKTISNATVKNGIIHGGINDGESLFLSEY
jgi:hypothetical protein